MSVPTEDEKDLSTPITDILRGEGPEITLMRWRLESLGNDPVPARVEPVAASSWPDAESRAAEARLRGRGINLPWTYGQEFGDKETKVVGLRAGGVGLVYIVESIQFGETRTYAAKTLQSFLRADYLLLPQTAQEKIAQSFLEEALPWLEMGQHPNVVPLVALKNIVHPSFQRNVPFILSRFMPMGSLERHLAENNRLSLKACLELGIQLCDGLLHTYRHGLKVHLDLKPDNIMMAADGVFKVTDFSSGVFGTFGYMAPEQVLAYWRHRGERLVCYDFPLDHRADQFAIGLIVLTAFLGQHPFPICSAARDSLSLARSYLENTNHRTPGADLSPSVQIILAHTLQSHPKDRYPSLSALRKELSDVYEAKFHPFRTPSEAVDDSPASWYTRGKAYATLGQHGKAAGQFDEARKRFRRILGSEIEEAWCTVALGRAYWDTGRLMEAGRCHNEALEIFRRIPGTSIEQAGCLDNLGAVAESTARYREAERCLREALAIYRQIPGTELDQANCMMNLGIVYKSTGQFGEAERCHREALAIYRQIPGIERQKANCIMNIGVVYESVGQFGEAEQCYGEALEFFRRIPGTDIEKARCTHNLGFIYCSTGRFAEAERYFEQALGTYRHVPGTEIEQVAATVGLGNVYQSTGRFSEAERSFIEALNLCEGIAGTDLEQARCTHNLGVVYWSTGRLAEAERLYGEALKIYRRIPGTDLKQANCMMSLANLYSRTGRFEEADKCYSHVLRICQRFPGAEITEAGCMLNLGLLHLQMSRHSEALEYAREALELCQNLDPVATSRIRALCNKILGRA